MVREIADILVNIRTEPGPVKIVEDSITRLGMRLRLTGRDLMRLGGQISRFFSSLQARIIKFLSLGWDWQVITEDIQWAMEDLSDIVGTALTPALEGIAPLIESLAEFLEENPWAVWLITIPMLLVGIGALIGKLLNLWGFLNLTAGAWMTARTHGLGFGSTLKYLTILITEGSQAADMYLASIGKVSTGVQALSNTIEARLKKLKAERRELVIQRVELFNMRNQYLKLQKSGHDVGWIIEDLERQINSNSKALLKNYATSRKLTRQQKLLVPLQKKEEKVLDRIKKRMFGWGQMAKKTTIKLGKLALIGGTLVGLGIGFFMAWEPITELFELFGEVFASAMEPLVPILEWISDMIEQNPELAKTLLQVFLAIGGGLLILSKFGILGKIAGKIGGKIGDIFGKATGPTKEFSKAQWKSTLALAALIGALAAFFYSITNFFIALSQMGVGAWEIVGIVGVLFGAILGFIFGLSLLTKVFSEMGPNVWKGIAALAALIAVVSLLIFTFTGFLSVVSQLPGGITILWNAVGAIIALMGVLMLFAAIAGAAFVPLLLGSVVIGILSASILALGAGLLFAGMGAMLLSSAFAKIVETLTQALPLAPALTAALFGIAAGLFAMGASGLTAFIGLVAALGGLIALTGGIVLVAGSLFVLAGAIAALAASLALIPEWARGAVAGFIGNLTGIAGGIAGFVGGLFGGLKVPGFQEGGLITRGGIAILHEGERVEPAEGTPLPRRETPASITVNINAPIGSKDLADYLIDEIERRIEENLRRRR